MGFLTASIFRNFRVFRGFQSFVSFQGLRDFSIFFGNFRAFSCFFFGTLRSDHSSSASPSQNSQFSVHRIDQILAGLWHFPFAGTLQKCIKFIRLLRSQFSALSQLARTCVRCDMRNCGLHPRSAAGCDLSSRRRIFEESATGQSENAGAAADPKNSCWAVGTFDDTENVDVNHLAIVGILLQGFPSSSGTGKSIFAAKQQMVELIPEPAFDHVEYFVLGVRLHADERNATARSRSSTSVGQMMVEKTF